MSEPDERLRRGLAAVGTWRETTLRRAAVLCPIVRHEHGDHVVFVVRPDGQRQHPGQVAFPGGMQHGDELPLATALRECHEEIGVPPHAVTVLGELAPRESSSGILVHCFVARVTPVPLVPDAREVARVLTVPLSELCEHDRWQELPPPGGATGAQPRTSPHFRFGDELLWGLTARFVRDLTALLGR